MLQLVKVFAVLSLIAASQASFADKLNLASLIVQASDQNYWQVQLRFTHPSLDTRQASIEFPSNCESTLPTRQTTENRVTQTLWQLACSPDARLEWIKLKHAGDTRTQITLQQVNQLGENQLQSFSYLNEELEIPLHFLNPTNSKPSDNDNAEVSFFTQGFHHLLFGYDHIAFIILLGLIAVRLKQLVWTVTAFTIGHSITLLLAALEFLPDATILAPQFVEIMIALSIVFLAVEALKPGDTLTRRFPAIIAFGFGLIHGLGFAVLLIELLQAEFTTPLDRVAPIALFNLGIECGQLIIVTSVFYLKQWYLRFNSEWLAKWLQAFLSYGLGSIASYWLLTRLIAS